MAYTIKKGQDLNAISRATGLSLAQLKALNPEAFKGSKQGINYAGTTLRTKTGEKYLPAKGLVKAPVDPRQGIADANLKNVGTTQNFQDVLTQEQFNAPFDEWTRQFAAEYMLPEWQRNTYEPAMRQMQQDLDTLNRKIGLTGIRGGDANMALSSTAEDALKQEENLRQQYQSGLASLRGDVQGQWAQPLYESQMKRYTEAPWRNIVEGQQQVGADIAKALGDLNNQYGVNAVPGSAGGIQELLDNLKNWNPSQESTVPAKDWTVQGQNTDFAKQYLTKPYTPYL